MTTPVSAKSWAASMLVNQTITFISLLDTLGNYVVGNTNQMIAKGFTCVGSSNGVTAAMDGVNRCTLAAGFAVRATIAGAAQSWIVVSDGTVQIKFTYKGASDDIATVAFSPGSLYVVAGTATFEPTATDERLIITTTSIIGSTASGNRVFHVWIDSTHRLWRTAIMSAGTLCGPLLWCELFDVIAISPVVIPIPVWGGAQDKANLQSIGSLCSAFQANSCGGVGKVTLSGTPTLVSYGGTYETFNNNAANDDGVNAAAQGGVPILRPIGLAFSTIGGIVGKAGNRIDWYRSSDFQACGSLSPGKDWVMINNVITNTAAGVWWPWPPAVSACTTS